MCRYHRLERRRMLGHLGLLGRIEFAARSSIFVRVLAAAGALAGAAAWILR
jgi:hypothetical protein